LQHLCLPQHELRLDVAGAGPPDLLCIHGLVDTLEIWDRVAAALAERARVARYDQRGHGESTAPPGPTRREDLAADTVAVLDALEIERAVLVGHSLGGIVAMTAALEYPTRVAGLVLIGTASQCSEKVAGWYERIARAGERDGNAGLARAIYGERRLLVGEKDPMGPKASRIIREKLVDATLELVPERGHWLHVEVPDVVVRALDRWQPHG
jgi:pimeloyl-ACP methyl ester carboxylesterase